MEPMEPNEKRRGPIPIKKNRHRAWMIPGTRMSRSSLPFLALEPAMKHVKNSRKISTKSNSKVLNYVELYMFKIV